MRMLMSMIPTAKGRMPAGVEGGWPFCSIALMLAFGKACIEFEQHNAQQCALDKHYDCLSTLQFRELGVP